MKNTSLDRAKVENDYSYVTIYPMMGRVEVLSRLRQDGARWIGEGRSLHYDGDGKLTKDTGWQPTGVEAIMEPERPWWRFW